MSWKPGQSTGACPDPLLVPEEAARLCRAEQDTVRHHAVHQHLGRVREHEPQQVLESAQITKSSPCCDGTVPNDVCEAK